jgi:hypothetical protein
VSRCLFALPMEADVLSAAQVQSIVARYATLLAFFRLIQTTLLFVGVKTASSMTGQFVILATLLFLRHALPVPPRLFA